MSLTRISNRKPVAVSHTDTLAEAARLMHAERVGAVVVVDHGRPIGMITDRDLALATCLRGADRQSPVDRVMASPVATINQDASVLDAIQTMRMHKVRRLPVVDDHQQLTGMLSIDDLLPLLSRELGDLSDSVKEQVAPAAKNAVSTVAPASWFLGANVETCGL